MGKENKILQKVKKIFTKTKKASNLGYMDVNDFFIHLEIESKKKNLRNWINNKFPNGYAGYNVFYLIFHPWKILQEWKNQAVWAWQRVFRGWDDRAVWSMDYYLSTLIPQLLKELKTKSQGIPLDFLMEFPMDENFNVSPEDEKKAFQNFMAMVDEVIEGFEEYTAPDGDMLFSKAFDDKPEIVARREKFSKAFDLLKKYYYNFWW